MFHFHAMRHASARVSDIFRLSGIRLLPAIAVPFLVGLAAGSVIGLYSRASGVLLSDFCLMINGSDSSSFTQCMWQSGRFVLLAAFLSTGLTGVFFLPLLSAFRAFTFACSISAVLQTQAVETLLPALFSFGISALIALPGFLLAANDGFRFSEYLIRRERRQYVHTDLLVRHGLIVLFLILLNAVYLYFVMPLLLAAVD